MRNYSELVLRSEASIQNVIECLNSTAERIVLVTDNENGFIGVVVDGDIRRGLLDGIQLTDSVMRIVNRNATFLGATSNLPQARKLMSERKISHIPIVDDANRLIGLYSRESESNQPVRNNLFVIMAGGFGKRLKPYTDQTPKPMLKVNGKPMLEHLILSAKDFGYTKFVIAVHYLAESIESHFGNGSDLGIQIEYLRESEPLGTAGALSLLIDKPALPFVVSNADLVSTVHLGAIVDFHNDQQSDATMAVQNFELQNPFGVVEVSNGDIVSIIEKPVSVSKISGGIYVLDPQMLDLLEPGKYCDMPELFRRAIDASMEVKAFMIHEEWADIGQESDLIKIQNK